MVDSVLSGYKAAAQNVSWTGDGINTATTGLTDNEWTPLSDAIDNSLTKYMMMDIEVELASAAFPVATDNLIEIYLVPSVDDTNYPNWGGEALTADVQENNQYFIGSVTISDATELNRMALRNVTLPPGKFKFGLRSRAGVSLAITGNALRWRPWGYSSQ